MKDKDISVSVESFYKQTPSIESIQAMEDSITYYINYDELQYLYNNLFEFNFIGPVLLQLSERCLYSIRMQRAQERYQFLLDNHHEIIQRVPLKYIASLPLTSE